jgi:hypothetical protein
MPDSIYSCSQRIAQKYRGVNGLCRTQATRIITGFETASFFYVDHKSSGITPSNAETASAARKNATPELARDSFPAIDVSVSAIPCAVIHSASSFYPIPARFNSAMRDRLAFTPRSFFRPAGPNIKGMPHIVERSGDCVFHGVSAAAA